MGRGVPKLPQPYRERPRIDRRSIQESPTITNPKGRECMTKESTEEKIVMEFCQRYAFPVHQGRRSESGHKVDADCGSVQQWLRTSLTSYRNDVLEEVLDEFRQCADDLENSMTTIPVESTWNSALRQSSAKIHALITSLKVDIIKR